MLIISDTSPITNLIHIGQINILQQVFEQLIVPKTVYRELSELPHQKAIIDSLSWIQVWAVNDPLLTNNLATELDPGEAEAIALALELQADYLIIDEIKGRNKAEELGLRIVGLLGILLLAKQKGHLKAIEPLLQELREKAGFRIRNDLYERILSLAGESPTTN